MTTEHRGQPAGSVYDWYKRGLALLRSGNPAAAALLLTRAHSVEPESRSIREALARAQFDSRQYQASAKTFGSLVDDDPADDYAHFGLGLALSRLGEHEIAHGHLAMAVTMRPAADGYSAALDRVRETLRMQAEKGGE